MIIDQNVKMSAFTLKTSVKSKECSLEFNIIWYLDAIQGANPRKPPAFCIERLY